MAEARLPERDGVDRREFLRNSGVVAGGVAVGVMTPAAVIALEDSASASDGGQGIQEPHPVVAYISNARRGEVTVVSGHSEKTYRDPVLTRRLAKLARSQRKA